MWSCSLAGHQYEGWSTARSWTQSLARSRRTLTTWPLLRRSTPMSSQRLMAGGVLTSPEPLSLFRGSSLSLDRTLRYRRSTGCPTHLQTHSLLALEPLLTDSQNPYRTISTTALTGARFAYELREQPTDWMAGAVPRPSARRARVSKAPLVRARGERRLRRSPLDPLLRRLLLQSRRTHQPACDGTCGRHGSGRRRII